MDYVKQKKERDSQFELLRILAMFFVVTGHLIIKGADTVGLLSPYSIEKDGVTGVIIYACVVGGGEFVCHDNGVVRIETGYAGFREAHCGLSGFRDSKLLSVDDAFS